jgi:hypothetical protein
MIFIINDSDPVFIDTLIATLNSKFSIKDLGALLLEIEVIQQQSDIYLINHDIFFPFLLKQT